MTARRVSEKVVQAQIRQALLAVGATVYTIGRPPRRDAVHKGTGQTPGIPDLCVHLPQAPVEVPAVLDRWPDGSPVMTRMAAHQLWIEVKAKGGRLSPEQTAFRDFCHAARIPHLVGGLDDVLAYLQEHGYIREYPGQYRRTA